MCSEIHIFSSSVFRCRGKKKETLPQHSVCDKSLKRTHDIGHFCRDDAAMQHPAGPAGALYSLLSILLNQKLSASVKGFLHFFAKLCFSAQTLC